MDGSAARYAIYFVPKPDSALFQLGNGILEGDAPRLYGFHATLKPPFRLAQGHTEDGLREALRSFVQEWSGFTAPPLQLQSLGSFLALTLSEPSSEFQSLAGACVRDFDRYRAPALPEERERRARGLRNPRQLELLDRWGYPYVLDQWLFHMTLTGSLPEQERREAFARLLPQVEPLRREPLPVDAIALTHQSSEDSSFAVKERFLLG